MSSWLRGKVGGKVRDPSRWMLMIERLADLRALVLQGDSRHAIGCQTLIIAPHPALAILAAQTLPDPATALMVLEPEQQPSWWWQALQDPRLARIAAKRWPRASGSTVIEMLETAAAERAASPDLQNPDRFARLERPKRLFPADMHPQDEGMIYLRETSALAAEPGWWRDVPLLKAPITEKQRTVIFARSVLLLGASDGFAPAGDRHGLLRFADVSESCSVTALGPATLPGGTPMQILETLDPLWPFSDS
ncbi:MAG: hypothetical protein Alpg2KO_13580 [Alphaproteobacteria bacterium]